MNRRERNGKRHNGSKQDGEDRRHVARKQEQNRVADIAVDVSAVGNRLDDGREVVVLQNHGCRVLGNLGSRDTHCDADIRLFERGRVVDAVARHGDDAALSLPRLDDADLIFGRYAGVDRDVLKHLVKFLVGHRVKLHARNRHIAPAHNADLLRDRGRGDFVVARDHDGLDARADRVGDRLFALFTRRVDHGHQTEEGVVVFGLHRERLVGFLVREGQHAETCLGIFIILLENFALIFLCDGTHAILVGNADAAVENGIQRSLCQNMRHAVELVFGAHHLSVGIEGHLLHSVEGVADNLLIQTDMT